MAGCRPFIANVFWRVATATERSACYFFFVGVGTAGRSCRAVKADCATTAFSFCCFGFFCSRLLRFWPLAIELLLNQSAPDPAHAWGGTKQDTPFPKRCPLYFEGAGQRRPSGSPRTNHEIAALGDALFQMRSRLLSLESGLPPRLVGTPTAARSAIVRAAIINALADLPMSPPIGAISATVAEIGS
jgi:hypothetical protein